MPVHIHSTRHKGSARMAVIFTDAPLSPEGILSVIRWYGASPLSTRHVEKLLAERVGNGDHATIN